MHNAIENVCAYMCEAAYTVLYSIRFRVTRIYVHTPRASVISAFGLYGRGAHALLLLLLSCTCMYALLVLQNHAKALQQLGWLHYKDEDEFKVAIEYLKRATGDSATLSAQSIYISYVTMIYIQQIVG
jgi:hypothetical protein